MENKQTKCKVCGKLKHCDACYDCYFKSIVKWMSEDNGKDVYLRLESKLNILKEEIEKLQSAFNIILAKKYKIDFKKFDN